LSASTGTKIWNYTTGFVVDSSPAVAGGLVYVDSWDYNVYCLDAYTGAKVWNYTTGWEMRSSPAVDNGVVYVGADDCNVYAFGASNFIHDVATVNLTSTKTVMCQGYCGNLTVTAQNRGDFTETFNVTAYANTTNIASQNVTLSSGNTTTLTFTWNATGFAYGNYTISAYAWPVPSETDTSNNNFTGGVVKVTIPGDINGDFKVSLADLVLLANAYGTTPASGGKPGVLGAWNPNADINGDGKVSLADLVIMANHYGQHYP
jgi:hypothetical protein